MYGVGPTVEEAMDDYRSALVEYYETLEEDANRLAKHLREQLELLRRVFTRRAGWNNVAGKEAK
jgi:isopenicillin N synthase-like dioxygenase